MAGSIDQGMFNFDTIMKQFYDYKPGKDDTEGRAIKNNFQANMIQSGFDAQMAKDMAQQQSSIAQSNMTHAADLEARNTSSNMQQEFNYGMQSMGAQFEYQDKFANNQFDRDLGTLAATGDQQRARPIPIKSQRLVLNKEKQCKKRIAYNPRHEQINLVTLIKAHVPSNDYNQDSNR